MTEAIFLSAGVPDAARGPEFAATADTVAITAAVSALLYVTLGRRLLVFGGHPAITPMVWTTAQDMGVDYGAWVQLYQSRFYEDDFPDETAHFGNVVFTDAASDAAGSLSVMRRRMFADVKFTAAVFIGGMTGIIDEFRLLREQQPQIDLVPLYSTGGAVRALEAEGAPVDPELLAELGYVGLLHRRLGISPKEARFSTPAEQPLDVASRIWDGKRS
jgi:hypothetical protein